MASAGTKSVSSGMVDFASENARAELEHELRKVVERLIQFPPIYVEAYNEEKSQIMLWFYGGPEEARALSYTDGVQDQQRIRMLGAVELLRWHRAAAATKRVWQMRDRALTEWKAAQICALSSPPEGASTEDEVNEKGKVIKKGWKAPPAWQIEAAYRAMPAYGAMNLLVERAEEAHSSCLGVVDCWQSVLRLLEALGG